LSVVRLISIGAGFEPHTRIGMVHIFMTLHMRRPFVLLLPFDYHGHAKDRDQWRALVSPSINLRIT
jgi:hypothetical protein